jgi:hypothetical protein
MTADSPKESAGAGGQQETAETKIHRKHKGARNELGAICWLLDQGYEVFRNVSSHGAIDLVAVRDNETIFIDVKSLATVAASEEQIALNVKLLRPSHDGGFVLGELHQRRHEQHVCIECGGKINIMVRSRAVRYCSNNCRAVSTRRRNKCKAAR